MRRMFDISMLAWWAVTWGVLAWAAEKRRFFVPALLCRCSSRLTLRCFVGRLAVFVAVAGVEACAMWSFDSSRLLLLLCCCATDSSSSFSMIFNAGCYVWDRLFWPCFRYYYYYYYFYYLFELKLFMTLSLLLSLSLSPCFFFSFKMRRIECRWKR